MITEESKKWYEYMSPQSCLHTTSQVLLLSSGHLTKISVRVYHFDIYLTFEDLSLVPDDLSGRGGVGGGRGQTTDAPPAP